MESFYGGRSGFSFIIVKSFASIAEMVECFSQGPTYTAVHYDEHVLINTENKNDPDNGKVYRRGYDYTNEMGGAIYIGTIVGPAGRAPMLELTTIEQVKLKQETEGYENRYTEGSYSVPTSLVPGKDGEDYNDKIEFACCCVRSENGEDSTAYIGFKVPYLVNDFVAESVSAYYNRSDNTESFINQNLTERVDNFIHPFYEKWHFSIPKGIKGDTFKDFRVIPADNSIEDYSDKTDDIGGIDDNSAFPRKVLVYDYYHYDKDESGEPVSLYLGDYNMIDNIALDKDGSVTIKYTHNDTDIYSNLFKWIEKVTLNKETGHFTVEYNYDTDENGNPTIYETDLSWVNNITIAEDGTVTVSWSTGESENLPVGLRWITNMQMIADGTVIVNYNDGTNNTFINRIQWISNVKLLQDGTFTVYYNNGASPYTTVLTWVEDIIVDDDGTVHIIYNNGEPTVYEGMIKYINYIYFNKVDEETGEGDNKFHVVYNTGEDEVIDNIIKFIDKVYIDDDETKDSDYLFHVVYNTGEDEVISTQPVNYINEVVINSTNYHLLVYYSNANIRQLLSESGKTVTYDEKDGWLDLGSIKDDAGILIGLNLAPSEHEGNIEIIENALEYLDENYPNGLTDAKYYGKIITIGEDGENKLFYAFDYDTNSWYYLGTFNNDVTWLIVGSNEDTTIESEKASLSIGGIWFIVEGTDDE